MLFTLLLKPKATARRGQWPCPEGFRTIAELWLQAARPRMVAIIDAEESAIAAAVTCWRECYDITVYRAGSAEEGLRQARRMAYPAGRPCSARTAAAAG